MRRLIQYCSSAVLILAVAAPVEAQMTVSVAPILSYYLPLGYFESEGILSTALPKEPSELRGMAWGGDVQVTLKHRWAVEAFAQTTTHTMPVCLCPGGPTDAAPVHVNIAAVMAQYDVSLVPTRYQLWTSAGPAFIRHSGPGYDPESPASWGGAFGVELALPLASHLDFVTKASGVGYWFNFDGLPERGPQLDALLSTGVRWRI